MNSAPNQWFETSLDPLSHLQNLRVWSIIVSLFGDLAQQPGDQISGITLTRIITPMGIKPEAIRVALHRLRKDGWIESSRSGRASVHFLTEFGRSQSAAVTPRIYARTSEPPSQWHLLIAEDGSGQTALEDALLLPQYISVNRNTALGQGPAPDGQEDLFTANVSALQAPSWLQERLFPSDMVEACHSLLVALQKVTLADDITAIEIACLRTLIVHHWRRIALRHPDLPAQFHPKGWTGDDCRARVFELLDQLPQPTLTALEESGAA